MASSDQRVIATAGILSVSVGTANSILKNKELPSTKFLIGSGVAFLILSALAEGEPDLAKGLSLGILTTIVLGDGGGVLSYIADKGEIDTKRPPKGKGKQAPSSIGYGPTPAGPQGPNGLDVAPPIGGNQLSPIPGPGFHPPNQLSPTPGPGFHPSVAPVHVTGNKPWWLDIATGIPGYSTNP